MGENKGFTLIEIIVTIAILSIVLAGVTTIMVAGSKSFGKGNADAGMQSQAQLVVNQIEDMIIDTNGGVDYKEDGSDRELILYNAFDAEDGIGTTYTKEVVKWISGDAKLVYSLWNVTYNSTTGTYEPIEPAIADNALLAEDVSEFSVDLSDTRREYGKSGEEIQVVQSVRITAGYVANGGQVAYATSPVITLRNRMMLSGSPKAIFDNTPVSDDTLKLYISGAAEGAAAHTPIRDRITTVECDGMYNIYAMINAANDVNSLVNWKIEEGGSASTIGETGILKVGEREPNSYLTIVATYKNNPGKYAKGVVKVEGGSRLSLDAVHITTKSLQAFYPSFASIVQTTGFSEAELQNLQYKWELSDAGSGTFRYGDDKDTADLAITQKEEYYGKYIMVTLTVKSPDTNQSVWDSVLYRIDQRGTSGEGYVERGNEGTGFDISYELDEIYGESYTVDYYFSDEYGNKLKDSDELMKYITEDDQIRTLHFRIDPALPADRGYHIKAVVHYTGTDRNNQPTTFDYEKVFEIAQVRISGRTTQYTAYSEIHPYSTYELRYAMSGYNQQKWAQNEPVSYEVESLVYDAPPGVTVDVSFGALTTVSYDNTMSQAVRMTVNGGSPADVTLKSLKVKVIFAKAPEIFAYSDIIFGETE